MANLGNRAGRPSCDAWDVWGVMGPWSAHERGEARTGHDTPTIGRCQPLPREGKGDGIEVRETTRAPGGLTPAPVRHTGFLFHTSFGRYWLRPKHGEGPSYAD